VDIWADQIYITDDFEKSCFKCSTKTIKLTPSVLVCLGKECPNLGKYIPLRKGGAADSGVAIYGMAIDSTNVSCSSFTAFE